MNAVGAAGLEFARSLHGGGSPAVGDFAPAFLLVAAVSVTSVLMFWRLEPDAGAVVSGRKTRVVGEAAAQPGE